MSRTPPTRALAISSSSSSATILDAFGLWEDDESFSASAFFIAFWREFSADSAFFFACESPLFRADSAAFASLTLSSSSATDLL